MLFCCFFCNVMFIFGYNLFYIAWFMLVQLINGKTIEIPCSLYLQLSEVDIMNLVASDGGSFYINCSLSVGSVVEIEDNDCSIVEKLLDINGNLPSNVVLEDEEEDDELDLDYEDLFR